MDHKTAAKLVSAYSTVETVNAALTTLSKADAADPGAISATFALSMRTGVGYNTAAVLKDSTFHGDRFREIVTFLILAERRRLSAIRAEAIRTINQIGGVEPPSHPYAI